MSNPGVPKVKFVNVNAALITDVDIRAEVIECPTKFEGMTLPIKEFALGFTDAGMVAPAMLESTALLADVIAAYNELVDGLIEAGILIADPEET